MKISRELVLKSGLTPKLRLGLKKTGGGVVSTGSHRVRFLEDKIIIKKDDQGKDIEYVQYTLEENGEKKSYSTKLRGPDGKPSYLVQRIAEIPEGTEAFLEMKKRGIKNYIEVMPIGSAVNVEVQDDEIEQEVDIDG